MKPVVIIRGPTASGKTSLAYALCKEFHGEIISADSRQVYRYADIGTNKERFTDIPTHLIDIRNPDERYNVAQFKTDALNLITTLQNQGKLVVIVGGTNFYIDVLIGKRSLYEFDPEFHLFMDSTVHRLQHHTLSQIHALIQEKDPLLLQTLNTSEIHNKRRLILKYMMLLFYRKVDLPKDPHVLPEDMAIQFALRVEKDVLTKRIIHRVTDMMHKGLAKEVAYLVKHFGTNDFVLSTIGYKEFLEYIATPPRTEDDTHLAAIIEQIPSDTQRKIVDAIVQHTLQYTKKQTTWLCHEQNLQWVEIKDDLSNKVIFEAIKKVYR